MSSSPRKKVSFDGDRRPLKSALKKRAMSPSESSNTLVEDTSEDDATTEKDESSEIDESDTSEGEVWVKKKKKRKAEKKPVTTPICKKESDSEDSSAVKDALPHETCDCRDCVKGRRVLKAMIKLDARQATGEVSKKADNEKQKGKQKGSKRKAETTSTEASETAETEATEEEKEPSSKQKKKGQTKGSEKSSSPKENKKPSPKTAELRKTVDKTAFKLPTYPKRTPPMLREYRAREKAKDQSEATNNVGPSHAQNGNTEAWASGGGNQGWGDEGNSNAGGNTWGQTSGEDGKPKECDLGFLRNEQSNPDRPSNKSAKGSPNGGWVR
ncbi:hypothetical protein UCDDA912_g03865 [Diaporthe ampelina]|uniref:Uncharacterized protein n=1 Tax=Diaporthe ampelina TaxID=1214573 RepID=A0A0G2FQ41_9PEZI|nr:hypothetical protein UCDDA912_g03865 [Diaporthe ampelina]